MLEGSCVYGQDPIWTLPDEDEKERKERERKLSVLRKEGAKMRATLPPVLGSIN
jgi:hypothetical protein